MGEPSSGSFALPTTGVARHPVGVPFSPCSSGLPHRPGALPGAPARIASGSSPRLGVSPSRPWLSSLLPRARFPLPPRLWEDSPGTRTRTACPGDASGAELAGASSPAAPLRVLAEIGLSWGWQRRLWSFRRARARPENGRVVSKESPAGGKLREAARRSESVFMTGRAPVAGLGHHPVPGLRQLEPQARCERMCGVVDGGAPVGGALVELVRARSVLEGPGLHGGVCPGPDPPPFVVIGAMATTSTTCRCRRDTRTGRIAPSTKHGPVRQWGGEQGVLGL